MKPLNRTEVTEQTTQELRKISLMASSSSLALALPIKAMQNPEMYGANRGKQGIVWMDSFFLNSSSTKRCQVKTMALPRNPSPKPKSVLCGDCDGNGAVVCSQCKGNGVNSVDLFNGQFKAGDSCWLCGGKKDMLCGNCNGAGFIGGFMNTFDE